MPDFHEAISSLTAELPRTELAHMIRTVRALDRLSRSKAYRRFIASALPETARFNPGHDSVMMGYDFHLTTEGIKLIEVNTNAGGGLLSFLAHVPHSILAHLDLPHRLETQLLRSFADENGSFRGTGPAQPGHIAIIDEFPEEQFLYPEMKAFAELFRNWGSEVVIADPSELEAGPQGVNHNSRPIDLIYNRHCDFYLEGEAMSGIRAAYLAGAVCLTPNPFTYGLLADKRRMVLWSDADLLNRLGPDEKECQLLRTVVPESHLLCDMERDSLWKDRKRWVFKPVSRFGSRGVLLGRKISRRRFDELSAEETLVQRLAEPSVTGANTDMPMKTDFRLYAYRHNILGVAARLYQGQVTNMRTAGGGFAPVRLV